MVHTWVRDRQECSGEGVPICPQPVEEQAWTGTSTLTLFALGTNPGWCRQLFSRYHNHPNDAEHSFEQTIQSEHSESVDCNDDKGKVTRPK